jgi:pyridoxal phosphate enzyme (YggS family)
VAQLRTGLSVAVIRENLLRVREQIDQAASDSGRSGADVEILAATKYVPLEEMATLAKAGVGLVGENRAQDLSAKHQAHGDLFTWDFIGQLQSRKVRTILPYVRLIHSVASDSALRELDRHRALAPPGFAVLIEVNLAGEPGKAGIAPEHLDEMIERSPVPVAGLMTMPPPAHSPNDSRSWFARLRELAHARNLSCLSMGTTQDYPVAVQEGATIVRIGTRLYD